MMAHANFIERAATSASQVLKDFDSASYKDRLESQQIGIIFDAAATNSTEGQASIDLSVRLLARLFPSISIISLEDRSRGTAAAAARLARSINPKIELGRSLKKLTAAIVVGETNVPTETPIYIGSDGWIARLSQGPVGSGRSNLAFGAGAAACIAVANLFRLTFSDQLERPFCDKAVMFSTFDYSRVNNPRLRNVRLGESHLVGLGAIGNGAIWALARTVGVRGELHLVDHELIELSNLQRYVLAVQVHCRQHKIDVAVEQMNGSALTVHPHPLSWADYLNTRSDWHFDRVAVAVDSEEDRIAVQGALPRWIANAWTQPGDLGISRHQFGTDAACLCCLYMPGEKRRNEDEIIRDALKLPPDPTTLIQIRELLDRGGPVGRELITRIATGFGLDPKRLMRFEDQPLRTFYTEAICGGAVFSETEGRETVPTIVPMAFQSALAGILLAGELVSNAAGLKPDPQPVKATINLLRPLPTRFTTPIARDRSGRCLCADEDFRTRYREKYPI